MALNSIATEIEAITNEPSGVALLNLDNQQIIQKFDNGLFTQVELDQYIQIAAGTAKLLVQGKPCTEMQHQDGEYMIYGRFTADQSECLIVKLKKRFDSLQICREVLRQFALPVAA